ncbi:SWI/SNF-related matrix-associated actin-dependent regulator of chromatin subfamily A-like protein 1 [Cocos nucifera]|uniref:SWI/SNF-related matrix-associated actin-dependent regulator of chromatin subfamily A-like protein 1 n=1 Tax=Cocos nucifera TaxID=13894 RepID=A0A8K0MWA9_COCNU|nr:SWI/SNF-related matrix-associated actin-dependent regulator of chromatin subfamily A-like protein 1 [Cocos nucifera]
MEDFDDWGLSAEQLDFLEEDAKRKISERKASSVAASASSSPLPSRTTDPDNSPHKGFQQPPSKTFLESRYKKVETCSPSRLCPSDMSKETENHSKADLPKLSVRIYLHASGAIAAKFPYHQVVIEAFHKIPKASWHGKERLWMFPPSSLATAEEVLSSVNGAIIEVQKLDPLVRRALAAACAAPDLRGKCIMVMFENSILDRFVLQHGGRALLADEMGLGKTLQVVLSQYGGSNRAGFKIVYSNLKAAIHLDGIFNIISYDVVPKIQDILLASEFKKVILGYLYISCFVKEIRWMETFAELEIKNIEKNAGVRNQGLWGGLISCGKPLGQMLSLWISGFSDGGLRKLNAMTDERAHDGVVEGTQELIMAEVVMVFFQIVIADESHFLKNAQAKRTNASLPVLQIFLDLNEKDMKQIRILFHEISILRYYFAIIKYIKVQNLKRHVVQLGAVKANIQACDSNEKIESLKFTQKNLINKIYNDSAEAKIPAVLDYLNTVVEADCKFLIFAHHQPMIDAIHQFLLVRYLDLQQSLPNADLCSIVITKLLQKKKVNCIRIDGGTPSSSRQALVNDFQEKDNIKAAVLSIKAGGVGLTLTAASTVIFAELSWTPGDIIQAEDRAHRIGQVSSVNIYYLLANDTVDDIIWDVVQSKLENLGQVETIMNQGSQVGRDGLT